VACFGQAIVNGPKCSLPECDKIVAKFVGFEKPMPNVNIGAGTSGKWWDVESKIVGISSDETDNVVTLILDNDRVSRLHGKEF